MFPTGWYSVPGTWILRRAPAAINQMIEGDLPGVGHLKQREDRQATDGPGGPADPGGGLTAQRVACQLPRRRIDRYNSHSASATGVRTAANRIPANTP
jgi:hypothetical protein